MHPSTTCDVVVQRRSLCRTCCVTRGSAASLSPHGQSPRSSLSLSPEGQIPPYRFPASTRPYSEIFCPLLPHLVSARPPARHRHRHRHRRRRRHRHRHGLPRLPLPLPSAAATRKSHNKPVDFSPATPYTPVYFVREAHRCVRRVNVRPSPHATDRRASYAPTHRSPVCFGFPGVTRTPHFSPVTSTLLFLSLCFSSSFLPYSPIPACSHSLSVSLLPLLQPRDISLCP